MQVAFGIHVQTTELTFDRVAEGQSVVGPIWLQLGDRSFPSEGWRDFVAVILGWWLRNVVLLADSVVEVENRFMDGPCAFNCRRSTESRLVAIRCYRNDAQAFRRVFHVARERYVKELARAASDVIQEFESRNLQDSRDIVLLKRWLQRAVRAEERRRKEGWAGWA